jgi:hypothetical protein
LEVILLNQHFVFVEDFNAPATHAKIQAAINHAAANQIKTVLLGDKDYYIEGTITVKKGVLLKGGYGSSITIGKNVRGFTIEQNASMENIKIAVDYKGYSKEVL